VVMRI